MNPNHMPDDLKADLESAMKEELLISELQLLYSEKRTSLSVLRTGIAVLTLPLSVFTVLVATSKYYNLLDPNTLAVAVPLMALTGVLMLFGAMLILRSLRRIKVCDRKISKIRKDDSLLNGLSED